MTTNKTHVYKSFTGAYLYFDKDKGYLVDCSCEVCKANRKDSLNAHIKKELNYGKITRTTT